MSFVLKNIIKFVGGTNDDVDGESSTRTWNSTG